MKEGKVAQAIADYATADRLSGKLPAKERAKIKRQRAQAEFVGGNPVDAISRLHEAIEVSPGKVARIDGLRAGEALIANLRRGQA
jgi:hypothetical protein